MIHTRLSTKHIIYSCLTLLLIFINNSVFADKRLKIAVLDISTDSRYSNEATVLRDMLEIILFKNGSYRLLERKNIDIILKQKGLIRTKCTTVDCAAKIGRDLASDTILTCSLTKTDRYMISYKLVNSSNNAVLAADFLKASNRVQIEKAAQLIAGNLAEKYNEIYKMHISSQSVKSYTDPSFSLMVTYGTLQHKNRSYQIDESSTKMSANISVYKNNLFLERFALGLQTGYSTYVYETNGLEEYIGGYSLLFSTRYSLSFVINQYVAFTIYPVVSTGALYLASEWRLDTQYSSFVDDTSLDHTYTLLVKPGLFFSVSLFQRYELLAGFEYATNFKLNDKDFRIYIFSLGLQLNF